MVTLAQSVTNCQSQLDSLNVPFPFWSSAELRVWINDAVRDIARRSESILVFNASLDVAPNVAKYALPSDVIRVHRVEFIPAGQQQVYPVIASTYDELDQIWGINPLQTASYPSVYCCWGTPGSMTIQFYPVPAVAAQINLYYYKMPLNLATDGSDDTASLVIPSGWEDLVVQYVTYRALMKAKRPEWQSYKALFDETLTYLVDVTRQAHDQGRYIQTQTGSMPQWLYSLTDE